MGGCGLPEPPLPPRPPPRPPRLAMVRQKLIELGAEKFELCSESGVRSELCCAEPTCRAFGGGEAPRSRPPVLLPRVQHCNLPHSTVKRTAKATVPSTQGDLDYICRRVATADLPRRAIPRCSVAIKVGNASPESSGASARARCPTS